MGEDLQVSLIFGKYILISLSLDIIDCSIFILSSQHQLDAISLISEESRGNTSSQGSHCQPDDHHL